MGIKVELIPERHTTTRLNWLRLPSSARQPLRSMLLSFADLEHSSHTLQATSEKAQLRHYLVKLRKAAGSDDCQTYFFGAAAKLKCTGAWFAIKW